MQTLNEFKNSFKTQVVFNQWLFVLILILSSYSNTEPRLRFVVDALLGVVALTARSSPIKPEFEREPIKPWIRWSWVLVIVAVAADKCVNSFG